MTYIPALALIALMCLPAHGERLRFDSQKKGDRETAVTLGYGTTHDIPDSGEPHFEFRRVTFRSVKHRSPRSAAGFEVFIAEKVGGSGVQQMGAMLVYRRNFLVRGSTALGYDLGFGAVHFWDELEKQSTQTNFREEVGLTLQIATGPDAALALGYRVAHTSNGGFEKPNPGINTSLFTVGYNWYH